MTARGPVNTVGAARFAVPPPPRRRRRLAAAGSGIVLLALLVGVPAVLLTLAGPLELPTAWPKLDDLARTVEITQVITVLVGLAWLLWAQFVVCVLVEVAAALRGGVLARPVPLSGPSQRLARALIASVLLTGTLIGTVTTAQAAAGPPPAVVAAPAVVGFQADSLGTTRASLPLAAAGAASVPMSLDGAVGPLAAVGDRVYDRPALDDEEAELDGRKVYQVKAPAGRHHDSLWAIAERHLGDGRRYSEIYRLNEGRAQPDGRSLHLARMIQPGWRLVMPDDAVGVPRYVADRSRESSPLPAPDTTEPGRTAPETDAPGTQAPETQAPQTQAPETQAPAEVAPQPGMSADEKAGQDASDEADRQAQREADEQRRLEREVAAAAPNRSEHTGISAAEAAEAAVNTPPPTPAPVNRPATRPSAQPSAAQPSAAQPSAAQPSAAQPSAARPGVPAGQPQATPSSASSPQSSRTVAPQPDAQSSAPATTGGALPPNVVTTPSATRPGRPAASQNPYSSSAPRARTQAPRSEAPSVENPVLERLSSPAALAGELAAAGLLAAALLSALLVIRRRRGTTAAPDPDEADSEVWLRSGADADRGALLDLALRSLTRSCREAGRPLPQAYGAVVDSEGLDLLLTLTHPAAPAPWQPLADGLRWRITYADAQHLVADGDSAYPLLASVGRDAQGRDALINLGAAAGPVAVVGSPAMAAAVVRALALGLAGNPWSRGIEVLTSDLPPALPAIAAGRLIPCAGSRDLTDRLEEGSGRMPRTGPIQILTGGPAPGSRPERVAVYGAPLNAPTAARLQALTGRRADLAVLVAGELPGARWRLVVDDAGRLRCDELSLNVTANRLGDGSIERLHALFLSASATGPRPGSVIEAADDGQLVETDDVTWAQAPVRVAVLGDTDVRTPGAIDPGRVALASELVAYLALHPGGAHPTVLASALWPKGVTPDVRDATIDQVREWLGADGEGAPLLRDGHDGRLRLAREVPCDWDVFRTLAARADSTSEPSRERDLLVRALHLVRGPVVGGITHGTYTWLPRTELERQAGELVLRTADRLATICAADGDQLAVTEAAAAGLRAVPSAQHLWRHILRAEHALGGPARMNRAVEHLRFALATSGVDVEPETQALIDHLEGARTGMS